MASEQLRRLIPRAATVLLRLSGVLKISLLAVPHQPRRQRSTLGKSVDYLASQYMALSDVVHDYASLAYEEFAAGDSLARVVILVSPEELDVPGPG